MPFGYACLAINGKEHDTMPETRNLCAQIPTALHAQVCEAREQLGLTTAQYITNLLTEYFEMKKNGGNQIMATAAYMRRSIQGRTIFAIPIPSTRL